MFYRLGKDVEASLDEEFDDEYEEEESGEVYVSFFNLFFIIQDNFILWFWKLKLMFALDYLKGWRWG